MKSLLLAISFVLLCSISVGCVEANVDAQVVVTHSFTSPNDIPGCPVQYASYCSLLPPTTVNLPPFTQKIHISLPAGASASAYIEELDVATATTSFGFVNELTVEVSAPGLPTVQLVDYKPSTAPGSLMKLFPEHQDLVPYIEAESTTFTIAVTGTVPDQEVPLDVAITVDGDASYSKGL